MTIFFQGGRELPNQQRLKCSPCPTLKRVASLIITLIFGQLITHYTHAQTQPAAMLHGEVRAASDSKPIEGASIRIDGKIARTDAEGKFKMRVDRARGKVLVRYIGYQEQTIAYDTKSRLQIRLVLAEQEIEEVISTGYQTIPKERATGSFEFIDSALFNRKVSTDLITRLEDVVPGMARIKYYGNNPRTDQLNINIRGVSSINSNIWPLVVIDGVPYENNMADYGLAAYNNINPNDIENITILKDAAAASIWGAQSANGVIVITTKRGKFNQKVQLAFNSNITVIQKPDLYYHKELPTADYIELKRLFYDKGMYKSRLNRWDRNVNSLIWLFKDATDGKISEAELETELDRLGKIDVRDDFMKYIYRPQVKQQHSLRLHQGSENLNFSFGLGYDRNLAELVTHDYRRLNVKTAIQAKPLKRLLLDVSTTYNESQKNETWDFVHYKGLADGVGNPPYMELADANGNPLPYDFDGFSPAFRDTVAGGRLQSFSYVPLEETYLTKQVQQTRELLLQLNANYKFDFGLSLNGLYAYQRVQNPITDWRSQDSYHARSQANSFANYNDREVIWNLPLGDHLFGLDWTHHSHYGRFNLTYDRSFADQHEVSFLAGFDVREVVRDLKTHQYYGYDPKSGAFQQVQFGKEIKRWNGKAGVSEIIDRNRIDFWLNRYVAFYANGSYTFRKKYIWSGSMRKDASNLFGMKANDRGQPFWSIGLAWLLSKEDFLKDSYFDYLKLRATYGYNGNLNTSTSPLPIMSIESQPHYITGQNYGSITKPPNPKLRWERVANLNFGLDFGTRDQLFSGSIEYYHKRANDLIGAAEVDPAVGFTHLTVNTANLLTKGWDISLNLKPIRKQHWGWTSNLVFAYSRTKVLKAYLENDVAMYNITGPHSIRTTPLAGKDLFSLLAYPWAGLDPADGMPRVYLNGEISRDYSAMLYGKTSILKDYGTQRPPYFGSWRNTLRFKQLELSCNVSYQLGHKFIRNTWRADFFADQNMGHTDYALRWQKPGDEAWTDVPVFKYPIASTANQVYGASSALIERGDQIKLRDIQGSFALPSLAKSGFKNFRIYAYVQNICTIWQANNKGIDNEYGSAVADPLSTSLGLSFNF